MEQMLSNICHLLIVNDITDTQFQKDMTLGQGTVSDWKRGKSRSYTGLVIKISKYFNVSADYLIGNISYEEYINNKIILGNHAEYTECNCGYKEFNKEAYFCAKCGRKLNEGSLESELSKLKSVINDLDIDNKEIHLETINRAIIMALDKKN